MRLRTKLVLVLVFVAVVLAGGVFVGFDHLKDQSVARAQANVDETATMTAAQIDDAVRERQSAVARAAAKPGAEQFDHTGPFLDDFLRNSRYHTASVVSANGTVLDYRGDVAPATREQVVGSTVNARYVTKALGGTVATSAVSCEDQCEFSIAAPIYDGPDVVGALRATVTLEDAGVFDSVAPVETGDRSVWVTATWGDESLTLDEREHSFDSPITATATVESTGWQVGVARSSAGVDTLLQSMLYIEVVSLLLVFGAVVTLGGWEYRTNLAQTNRLLAGFRALRDGDYDHRLSLRAAAEWRRVSDGFNDLAERIHEREEQLQILNRVLRHNLRNDLSVVSGNAERVKELSDDPEVQAAADRILAASDDVREQGATAREIESVMATARTERETVDVADELRGTLDELQAAHPRVTVDADLPDSLTATLPVGADVALDQVCENAFEHNTSDDPRVQVRASRDDTQWVSVTVVDNGPGIPEQDREAITAGEETPLEHSSGLGLWFVHWFVQRADGTLTLDENDPTGASVTLELPDRSSD